MYVSTRFQRATRHLPEVFVPLRDFLWQSDVVSAYGRLGIASPCDHFDSVTLTFVAWWMRVQRVGRCWRRCETKVQAILRRQQRQLASRRCATAGPKPAPITPPKPEEITAAIERGVKFLLADQRPDGSWGSPENTKSMNIYAPPPGAHDAFRTAVTSLVIMALIEAQPQRDGKRAAGTSTKPSTAAPRGSTATSPNSARATPDALYNVWGHAYAIQALVALHQRAERQRRTAGQVERAGPTPGRHARPLQLCRRRLVLLRFPRRHANAQRRGLQLHHGHGPHRAQTSRRHRRDVPRTAHQKSDRLDPPPTEARFQLRLRRIPADAADAPDQPPRRQPGPLAGLQPRAANVRRPTNHRTTCSRPGSIACSPATAG